MIFLHQDKTDYLLISYGIVFSGFRMFNKISRESLSFFYVVSTQLWQPQQQQQQPQQCFHLRLLTADFGHFKDKGEIKKKEKKKKKKKKEEKRKPVTQGQYVSDTRCPALHDCEFELEEAGQWPQRGQSPSEHRGTFVRPSVPSRLS